jgi:hypothetical protein
MTRGTAERITIETGSGYLISDALASNATHAAMADVSRIQFHADFRNACEKNACGRYNTSWMGPPAVVEISRLIERA